MAQLIRNKPYVKKEFTIKEYYEKRNKVLIWNEKGGLGDVFMQRMLFEDVLSYSNDIELYFACLPNYKNCIIDHPNVKDVLDSRTINPGDWICHYNTCVTIADRYENYTAPNCKEHRSDIWAAAIGIKLKNHNMNFVISEENKQKAKNKLRKGSKKIVGFAPMSAMATKSLLDWQINLIINELKKYNCDVVGFHKNKIKLLEDNDCECITNLDLQELIAFANECDYIISVDTAFFHLSGGLNKPLMGIFTFADGRIYGKYFNFTLVQKHRDYNKNWTCGPCFTFGNCPKTNKLLKPCLTEITEEEIIEGIKNLMKNKV